MTAIVYFKITGGFLSNTEVVGPISRGDFKWSGMGPSYITLTSPHTQTIPVLRSGETP